MPDDHQDTLPNPQDIYRDGKYMERNPSWHVEDSAWKAAQIARALTRLPEFPETICEVGCGAGEILRQLEFRFPPSDLHELVGYDVSPHAIEMARTRESHRTKFVLGDAAGDDRHFDALLCVDVFEHVENYLGFLKQIRQKADFFVFHVPLDLNCEGLLRNFPMQYRELFGHIHYFTRDTALAALRECGYTVLDDFYTPSYQCMPDSLHTRVTKAIRGAIFTVSPRIAARLINGFHVMVVARR